MMRYVKTLGIAAVLAVGLASYSPGPAFAGETLPNTVLCKTSETTCAAGNQYPSGTEMEGRLVGSKMKLKAGFAVIECAKSEVAGTPVWNAENHTPHSVLTTETFTECNLGQTITVLEKAELVIHHEIEAGKTDTGVTTIVGGIVEIMIGSVACRYGGTVAGSGVMTYGGAGGVAKAEETKLTKVAGSAACASPAAFIAEYEITTPRPLHLSTT